MMQDRFKIFDKLFHHSLHDNSIVVFHVLGDHHRRLSISSKWGHQTSLEDRPDIIGSIEGSSLEIENTLIYPWMGFHYKILIMVYTPKPVWPWKKWPTDSRQCQGHHLHSQLLPTPLYTEKKLAQSLVKHITVPFYQSIKEQEEPLDEVGIAAVYNSSRVSNKNPAQDQSWCLETHNWKINCFSLNRLIM